MAHTGSHRWLLGALLGVSLGACGGRAKPAPTRPEPIPMPVPAGVNTGDCADPARDGALGEDPIPKRADRDLDGDGNAEIVVADERLCTPEGNCHWNVFREQSECLRYVGTLSAARIEALPHRGEAGFADIRAIWRLTDEGRLLLQEYQFRRGGYHVADVLLCRQSNDDRVLCSETGADLSSDPEQSTPQ